MYYGGRGSGKSHNIATALIMLSSRFKLRILCTREIQNSIKDSVHKLLSDIISGFDESGMFLVKLDSIINIITGSEFIFKGLRSNPTEIKSMEGIDIAWLEEAQAVSKDSLDILMPTIRKEGSIIVASFNRNEEKDPIYKMFCDNADLSSTFMNKSTIDNNPFASKTLLEERERCKRRSLDDYDHIWNGNPIKNKANRIIKREWFKFYRVLPKLEYKIIVVDTAQKTKEANDYTVFQCWGVANNEIYLIDQYRGKIEAPELRKIAKQFWAKHSKIDEDEPVYCRMMYVEDKVSGTGLIQEIKADREMAIPVKGIQRYKDKYTRVLDVVDYIFAQRVNLPEGASFIHDFIEECEAFNAAMTHEHDDQIDPMCDAINIALINKQEIRIRRI